jgi:uncharacterized membrane protein YcaP (DUF421 family)
MTVETVLRAVTIYFLLIVVFRIAGKRAIAEVTTFDFVMLLIISETTQQAMIRDDHSLTAAFLLIVTWVGVDIGLSLAKQRSKWLENLLDGIPVIIVADGRPLPERMRAERVDEDDILSAARHLRGLERMDQIRYAVLERSGGISIIPAIPATMANATGAQA